VKHPAGAAKAGAAPHPVATGTAINLASRLLAVALVLAITTYSARLGTAQQGSFALFTSVEGVLLALFSGLGVALARQVSRQLPGQLALGSPLPTAPLPGLLTAMLCACVLLGGAAALMLWGASVWGGAAYQPLWLLALAAPWLLLAPNISGWWLGEGRMAPMAATSLAPPALTLLGLLILGWAAAGATAAVTPLLWAWVVAKVLVGFATVVAMARAGRLAWPRRPAWLALQALLPFVATIGVTNLISLLNYRVGLFVVERVLGLSATGVYSIAVVMAELLWFVSGSLTQAAYSRIGTPSPAQAAATTVRVVQLSAALLLLLAPLVALGAAVLVPLLLGPAYAASVGLLAWLLPGVLVFGAAGALSAYFTHHAGRPQVPAQVAALSLAINAVLCLLLVPRLGMAGAACAASLAYGTAITVLAVRFVRHAGLPLRALCWPGAQLWADLRRLGQR
jgi:O-antigen/teichoic acid export membrane protein